MIQKINGLMFAKMVCSASAAINNQKQKINELNVFPVPDGDTGTNMGMTMNSAGAELKNTETITLSKAADKTASALLRGARGNSGVILSLLFRGFSVGFKGKEEADGIDFANALQNGVDAAYKAVMKPAEGTILTVSRLTANACKALAEEDNSIEYVLENVIAPAKEALQNTMNQNPTLKKAGVVDAGGMGFVAILEAMLSSIRGNDVVCEEKFESEQADFTQFDSEEITFAFDTVFIVRKFKDTSLEPLRHYLDGIGDCLVIGEDDEAFKVHVHTNIPGSALSEAQKYGTLELAKIENMRMQHDDLAEGRSARSTDDLEKIEKELEKPDQDKKPYGFVAVCAGSGLAQVFSDLGVDQVVEGGQTMNPSTDDILHAIRQAAAETVFILPNNKNIIMAAQQAAQIAENNVIVIPSKSVPQGMTAMMSFDENATAQENEDAMTQVLDTVTTLQITYAARDSELDGKKISEGDYLALCGSSLFGTDKDITALLRSMAQKVQSEGKEFVNIFYGSDTLLEDAQKAADLFTQICPNAEVNLMNGGQPIYYYLISVE